MPRKGTMVVIVVLTLLAAINGPAEAQFCAGDCNLDSSVTIDELLVGVNIVLGLRNRHDCPPADSNNDEMVTVDELVQAVHSALDGCPHPIPICHDAEECPSPYTFCRAPGAFTGCGICHPFVDDCSADIDCRERGAAFICAPVRDEDCACSPATICQPGCISNGDCEEGQECDSTHRCVVLRCASGICPGNFRCEAGTPTAVCLRQPCERDAQCPSGFCVNRACYAELGTCGVPVP